MSRHTEGPWVYDRRGENLVGRNGVRVRVYGSGLSFSGLPDDESKANARLIAAAPELLEALKDLVDACDGNYWELTKHCNEIIAKAEGK